MSYEAYRIRSMVSDRYAHRVCDFQECGERVGFQFYEDEILGRAHMKFCCWQCVVKQRELDFRKQSHGCDTSH